MLTLLLLSVNSLRLILPIISLFGTAPTFFTYWFLLRFLTLIYPRHIYRRCDDHLYSIYQRFVLFFFQNWVNVKIYVHGDYEEIFKKKENILYISNHQSSLDWIIANMLAIHQGSLGHIRYVLKNELKWIPLYGFYFYQHGCIYVRRNDKGDFNRVQKGINQIEYNGLPVWLVIFPEGTRFNPINNINAIQRSRLFAQQKGLYPFDHVLYPRSGATISAIKSLKHKLDAIYDITIMYNQTYDFDKQMRLNGPSMSEYLQGQINELHIDIRRIEIDEIPSETDEQISNWIYQRFYLKDKLLKKFYEFYQIKSNKKNLFNSDINDKPIELELPLRETIYSGIFLILTTLPFLLNERGRSFYIKIWLFSTPLTLLWMNLLPVIRFHSMMCSPNNGSGVCEEDDKCVPRAAVYKMIKDCTPQIRVSGEAKELFVQCCNEFIHTLALQANAVCEQQAKKLIHPDHIVTALDNLGFTSYKSNCLNAMETAQEEMAQKRKKLHGKPTSIYTQEELRRQQELLFEQAREELQQLEEDDWARTQELSKEVLRKKMEASRTDDDNYDD